MRVPALASAVSTGTTPPGTSAYSVVLTGSRASPKIVRPAPRSSGVPIAWVTASTGTMVEPLAARMVRSLCISTTAWVAPWPGMTMGASARWVTRSMGTTTSCTPPAEACEPAAAPTVGAVDDDVAALGLPVVDVDAPVVDVDAPVVDVDAPVVGVDAPVAGADGRGTPLVVTT